MTGTVGLGSCRDGVSLHPAVAAADVAVPDLVVVPGLDDDLATSFAVNRGWVPWLTRWHAAGARIAGSGTGAFLVADAGLLDGRPATYIAFGRERAHDDVIVHQVQQHIDSRLG